MKQEHRLGEIKALWLAGEWREPWIALIDEEFPGAGPSDEDIENFIRSAGDAALESFKQHDEFERIRSGILAALDEADYVVDHSTTALVVILALRIHRLPRQFPLGRVDVRTLFEAKQLIRDQGASPDHRGWVIVLAQYFPL